MSSTLRPPVTGGVKPIAAGQFHDGLLLAADHRPKNATQIKRSRKTVSASGQTYAQSRTRRHQLVAGTRHGLGRRCRRASRSRRSGLVPRSAMRCLRATCGWVLGAAAEHDAGEREIALEQLVRFLVAALDGLVLQYAVHHDAEQSQHDVSNVIAAGVALTSLSGAPVQ